MEVNDALIREWNPRYDDTEFDEDEYRRLVTVVARDLSSKGTISERTFLDIFKWKGGLRVIGHVKMEAYDALYAPAIRRVACQSPDKKLGELLAPGRKLSGIGAPTGSTIIHFMHPQIMPIIDIRTVEVLFEAGLVASKQRNLERYAAFCCAIEELRLRCPGWSLREIDRALFVYHKQVLGNGRQKAKG